MKVDTYAGTLTLTVLALKRDRVRLVSWILAIAVMTGLLVASFGKLLPTDGDLMQMTAAHSSHPVMRAFLAPASGISLGGFVMMRMSTVIALAIAFFGILTVTRHTRHNEESGCEELTRSTVVGRQAGLLAALLITVSANVLLAALIAVAFMVNGEPAWGSLAAGSALGGVGIAFAGVAAITAQLAETTSGANGMAGLAIGAAFLFSGTGNMLGEFRPESMEVMSAWPVWMSPFGWYQQVHAFHQNNWWVLLLFAVFFGLCVKGAFMLNSRRDVGMGMIPSGVGPATASPGLLSHFGLAWRLQRRLLTVWSLAVAVFGAVFSTMMGDFSEKMSGLERADEIFGDIFGMNETFIMALMALLGPFIAFYTVQAFLRVVSEESKGLLEPVLATAVTRERWIGSQLACVGGGTILVLTVLGLSGSISALLETGIRWSKVMESALLQGPAILLLLGFSVFLFGLAPRWTPALSWSALGISLLAGPFLAPALDLPQWVRNISPFTHVPEPAGETALTPVVVLLLLALLLALAGIAAFSRRDIRT